MIITEPNKDIVVLILNYNDYANKMMAVLGDGDKFIKLGLDKTHNGIKSIELSFTKVFSQFC